MGAILGILLALWIIYRGGGATIERKQQGEVGPEPPYDVAVEPYEGEIPEEWE